MPSNLLPELEALIAQNGLRVIASAEIRMDLAFVKLLYQWNEVNYPKEIKAYLRLRANDYLDCVWKKRHNENARHQDEY